MRSVAPGVVGDRRSRAARTGAPISARTALTPTERSSVVLPDMFDPLTMSTRGAPPSATSLGTAAAAGNRGCDSRSASYTDGPSASAISGNGSAGCSQA